MNYEQIVMNMKSWCYKTYSNGLPTLKPLDYKIKDQTLKCFEELKLANEKMTGNSIVGLMKFPESENYGILFSDIFHKILNEDNFISPAYFAYKIIKQYSQKCEEYNDELANGLVCRGLRTLASFFREICLNYKISKEIPSAVTETGAKQDIVEHTDIKLQYNDMTFRIWSYQSNSLDNTIRKIKGERGELPPGLFILCPLNTNESCDIEDVSGWYMYSDDYINRVISLLQQKDYNYVDKYSDVIKEKSDDDIKKYISKIQLFVKEEWL